MGENDTISWSNLGYVSLPSMSRYSTINNLVVDLVLPHCAHLIRVDAIPSDKCTGAIEFC